MTSPPRLRRLFASKLCLPPPPCDDLVQLAADIHLLDRDHLPPKVVKDIQLANSPAPCHSQPVIEPPSGRRLISLGSSF